MGGQKIIYFWLSENLLRLYWSSGSTQNIQTAKEKSTYIEVASITSVTPTPGAKKKFRVEYVPSESKSSSSLNRKQSMDFDAMSSVKRGQWVAALNQLQNGDLEYRLEFSDRDQTTVLSIRDQVAATVTGYDHGTKLHMVRNVFLGV